MLRLQPRAAAPLIAERDPEIKEKAIEKISEDLKGKQRAGRGHKKKPTEVDVRAVLCRLRTERLLAQVKNTASSPSFEVYAKNSEGFHQR